MDDWKVKLLQYAISILLTQLSAEQVMVLADKLLDWGENTVQVSENKIDDTIFLPIAALIRTTFNIPDND